MDRQIITVNTSGTITLDFDRETDRFFKGNAAITGAKTIEVRNDTNAEGFALSLEVTTSAVLTFPSNFKGESTESRWVTGDKELTLTGTGTYIIAGMYDGAYWNIKASTDGGFV